MDIRLHHHREQRPVDPTAAFQDRWKETPAAQLRDLQLDIASLGGQQSITVAVPPVRPATGTLVVLGADHLRRFRIDQRLQHELDTLADHVDIATGADRVEQTIHVRLREGHQVSLQPNLAVQPKISR